MDIVEHSLKQRVVVFAKSQCPYSKKTRQLLDILKIDYQLFLVDELNTGKEIHEYLIQKTGQKSVPYVFLEGKLIGGNSDLQKLYQEGGLQPFVPPVQQLDAPLVLYDHLLAYFPARSRLTMMEKQLRFNHKIIDIFNGESLKPEFIKINPKSTLPVLVHGDKTITDSNEICVYLDDVDGKPLGGHHVDRVQVHEWLKLMADWDGNLYMESKAPAAGQQLFAKLNAFKIAFAQARAKEHPELAHDYNAKIAKMSHQHTPEEIKKCEEELDAILDKVEDHLKTTLGLDAASYTPQYLAGAEYSLADLFLTCLVYRVEAAGQKQVIESRPYLTKWYERMKARPSFKQTFKGYAHQKLPLLALLPTLVANLKLSIFGSI
ncbi:thioredoxin-like protein [Gorgonomyces haynaldii]|nr:thioredoxin-like protein [Gorgonomyces haynaldii]